jgi:glutaredoxin
MRIPAILLIAGLLAAGCGGSERVETKAASPQAVGASGEPLQTAAPADVVVYTASWCGWCQKTLAWLDERGVPYENRDIEVDPQNRQELIAKSGGTGIPLVLIDGTQIQGFAPDQMAKLLDL